MARLLLVVVVTIVLIMSYGTVRYAKESYKIFPINEGPSFQTADLQNWLEFEAPTKKFRVLFPSLPQHASNQQKNIKQGDSKAYEMYVAEKDDGTVFMISLITFPNKLDVVEGEEVMRSIFEDMVASDVNNKVILRQSGKYEQFDALEFSIENQIQKMNTRTFVVGNTVYVLSSVTKIEKFNPEEFRFFLNSFELIGQQAIDEPDIPATPFLED